VTVIRCVQIHPSDNVATLLDDVPAASVKVRVVGASTRDDLTAAEPIPQSHKIALRDLRAGEPVVKFGVAIGRASEAIAAGQWVHLHNCASSFDDRSQTLDVHTGATTDTKYE
jgi:hypothetical protein